MEMDDGKELTKQDILLLNKLQGLRQMHQASFIKTEGDQYYDANNLQV